MALFFINYILNLFFYEGLYMDVCECLPLCMCMFVRYCVKISLIGNLESTLKFKKSFRQWFYQTCLNPFGVTFKFSTKIKKIGEDVMKVWQHKTNYLITNYSDWERNQFLHWLPLQNLKFLCTFQFEVLNSFS